MRSLLSDLITQSAVDDPNFIILSGDHGYALFDQIRQKRPSQFVNVGVAEQGMIGLAAGLARVGYKPMVYGLSAFVPVRVLEQIKLDVCYSKLPVTVLGDGAGLVYSTLGASHQCGEDIACLRPLPEIQIFSPCDAEELRICYTEAARYSGPSYIRIGKSDRPAVHSEALASTAPHLTVAGRPERKGIYIAATGSMVSPGTAIAREFGLSCVSFPRIKPFDPSFAQLMEDARKIIVIEEHNRHGGLTSTLMEAYADLEATHGLPHGMPRFHPLCLEDKFSKLCGSYQYALSEHHLSDRQLVERVRAFLG